MGEATRKKLHKTRMAVPLHEPRLGRLDVVYRRRALSAQAFLRALSLTDFSIVDAFACLGKVGKVHQDALALPLITSLFPKCTFQEFVLFQEF